MNGTNQNQSLGKSELRYYFIRLTTCIHTSCLRQYFYVQLILNDIPVLCNDRNCEFLIPLMEIYIPTSIFFRWYFYLSFSNVWQCHILYFPSCVCTCVAGCKVLSRKRYNFCHEMYQYRRAFFMIQWNASVMFDQ